MPRKCPNPTHKEFLTVPPVDFARRAVVKNFFTTEVYEGDLEKNIAANVAEILET